MSKSEDIDKNHLRHCVMRLNFRKFSANSLDYPSHKPNPLPNAEAHATMPRTFLIDTDTGSDDAVAIIMALRAPDIRVAAITVVAGNIPLQQGISNVLY